MRKDVHSLLTVQMQVRTTLLSLSMDATLSHHHSRVQEQELQLHWIQAFILLMRVLLLAGWGLRHFHLNAVAQSSQARLRVALLQTRDTYDPKLLSLTCP